jgi:hypothetical protein
VTFFWCFHCSSGCAIPDFRNNSNSIVHLLLLNCISIAELAHFHVFYHYKFYFVPDGGNILPRPPLSRYAPGCIDT